MHATVRRYDGIDETRIPELVKKSDETLLPRLSKLPGFSGFYLIEAGNGVMSSINFFDTPTQAEESSSVVNSWVREEQLESVLPNAPKITHGEVVVQKTNGFARA
jgi:hypothetical protein